jgi:hypothetical protein
VSFRDQEFILGTLITAALGYGITDDSEHSERLPIWAICLTTIAPGAVVTVIVAASDIDILPRTKNLPEQ